jgi:hypothetical protein
MLSKLITLLLVQLSYAYDVTTLITVDTKYEQASRTTIQAIYIQSGWESKVTKVKDVTTHNIFKWTSDNGLSKVISLGSAIVPVIFNKKIEVHTGNFILSGSSDKKEVLFILGF